MAGEREAVGQHALLDITGADRLDDPAFLEHVLRAAAEAAGAHVIGAHFHHFGPEQGVTGVLLLAESHISVHTWPERDLAAFDIFMCGAALTSRAVATIGGFFPGAQITSQVIPRG
jgi:S-adenosylmethionine decarboxylase